ncbi:Tyrosine-protein phosphatase 1 [Pleurostoma richardsiae]|uniref:protein-tyrosine-phosphatase n=1 Tax=Pleurostoma richardsiae TaxID=41990 RepID=A0AA38RKJ8_9PEZI|nr:Tyrosine-protein phosphatase 1 [Pleurostoma richardsiae]
MAPRQPSSAGPDRTVYYNMKTARPPMLSSKSHSHAHPQSPSHSSTTSQSHSRPPTKATTPITSPRLPYSVGQPHPPKLSPSTTIPPRQQKLSTPSEQVKAQDARAESPNYFGLVVEPTNDRDSADMPKSNWSPPTSSVKSFQAAIPQQLPLDANPEFEAFRKQADANRGRSGFSLGTSSLGGPSTPAVVNQAPPSLRPRPPRWHTCTSDAGSDISIPKPSALTGKMRDPSAVRMEVDADNNSLHDSAYVSCDSKRNSEASLNPPSMFFGGMPTHESPAQFESPFENRSGIAKVDDRHPRLSLVQGKADPPSPDPTKLGFACRRSDTVPTKLEPGAPSLITPKELKDLIEAPESDSQLLLLDLRVAPQYAQCRIKDALNLCIPTTLLKRATFNLQKLQQTFQNDADREKFARWRDTKSLVVYDAFSSERRDAVSSLNMLKKFTNEGYAGTCSILRGGFNSFAQAYPSLVDTSPNRTSGSPVLSSLSGAASSSGRPSIAPVIGGVMLPTSNDNANPFFANIRQNQDLVDGVGQMDISVPSGLDTGASLPKWLREAADAPDHGKKVSEKFLSIELAEQSRMKKAYSMFNAAVQNGAAKEEAEKVQLSGVEKGGKNRYKDILPFEHARVKLQGRPEGVCDYVNASHIKASRSNKRYIASQGPLPATFEDFWSVIWDEDVRVIVMLTAESEGGQLKCHPYWTGREYGPIKLRLLSEKKVSLDIDKHRSESNTAMRSNALSGESSGTTSASLQHHDSFGFGGAMVATENGRRRANTTTALEGSNGTPAQSTSNGVNETPFVIIRKFALSHGAHPFAPIREITHLHYPSWPDFGAPAQPSHLLALVELANVMQHSSLPVDVPGAIASGHNSGESVGSSESSPRGRSGGSRSPKRKADAIPLSWQDEPEDDDHARPMLVHCSAGCGRTGAFCTVDSVIDMLKRQRLRNVRRAHRNIERKLNDSTRLRRVKRDAEGDVSMDEEPRDYSDESVSPSTSPREAFALSKPMNGAAVPLLMSPSRESVVSTSSHPGSPGQLDVSWMDNDAEDLIAKTVEDFRGQRLSMVQSLRQFVLCYETVIEWIWRVQERGGPGVGLGPGSGMGSVRSRGRSGTFTG